MFFGTASDKTGRGIGAGLDKGGRSTNECAKGVDRFWLPRIVVGSGEAAARAKRTAHASEKAAKRRTFVAGI